MARRTTQADPGTGHLHVRRGNCTFRQRDVTSALRAVAAAGREVQRLEIDRDGRIIVLIGVPVPIDDLDTELRLFKAQNG
jgi:hypothetical protein